MYLLKLLIRSQTLSWLQEFIDILLSLIYVYFTSYVKIAALGLLAKEIVSLNNGAIISYSSISCNKESLFNF